MKNMMLVFVMTITTWLFFAPPASTWAASTQLNPTITFDVGKATINSYATFIVSLRNQARDPTLRCYGIPMLPSTSASPKYLLITLRDSTLKTITLILRRNNLYVMGYSDTFDNKCRYQIFRDVTATTERNEVRDALCPNANARVARNINYDSSYPALEGKAGRPRSQVQLGIQILNSGIGKISGVDSFTEKTQAEVLLVAIQMVSEAARFKYIENQVKTNFNRAFYPNAKVLNLEETWGKISTAIHNAKNGALTSPLQLKNSDGSNWIILRVDEIKPDMGLLNYVSGTCQTTYQNDIFPQVIMSTYYNYMANLGDLFEGL